MESGSRILFSYDLTSPTCLGAGWVCGRLGDFPVFTRSIHNWPSFHRWALDNNAWQARVGTFYEAIAPRSTRNSSANFTLAPCRVFIRFFGPAMLPLLAPRPLLVINGDSDSLTPLPGVTLAANRS